MPVPTNSSARPTSLFGITPSDSASLAKPVRFIRCLPISGAAGTLHVRTIDGDDITTEIAKGERLEMVVTKVFATGTTATGLEGHP